MIREVEVANFQSLRKLRVPLGQFTVITGPTGAGKSAFMRALRLLVFNERGTRYVTRGEKSCMVSAAGEDEAPWRAVIQRGGKDSYQLAVGVHQKTYTKLQGKVPEAVTEVLRLGPVNFAGQFDKPYLLDNTGSDVARVLGKLTNVTLVFKAAQEANRRRLQANAELKTRQGDLAALQDQLQQYSTLGEERAAVIAAEDGMRRLTALSQRRDFLQSMVARLVMASNQLKEFQPRPEPPSLARLEELTWHLARLQQLTSQRDDAWMLLQSSKGQEMFADGAVAAAQQALNDYSSQWGVCPTCGQPTRKDHSHEGAA